jgi:hypothetical protein
MTEKVTYEIERDNLSHAEGLLKLIREEVRLKRYLLDPDVHIANSQMSVIQQPTMSYTFTVTSTYEKAAEYFPEIKKIEEGNS